MIGNCSNCFNVVACLIVALMTCYLNCCCCCCCCQILAATACTVSNSVEGREAGGRARREDAGSSAELKGRPTEFLREHECTNRPVSVLLEDSLPHRPRDRVTNSKDAPLNIRMYF